MCNGIYCDVESYTCEPSPDERRFRESREKLDYLKASQRRLTLLMKQLAHHQRNPLGGAKCKEVEMNIYQQILLINRNHQELKNMVDEFNRMIDSSDDTAVNTPSQQSSSQQADWEEVMEMAKLPIESISARTPAKNGSSTETLFKSIYISPPSTATAPESGSVDVHIRRSKKTFSSQTPPAEEMTQLRESLKSIEQSPLFTATPVFKSSQQHLAPLAIYTGLRSPNSLP
ncbi:hypothetical protein GGF44_002108 [Coemansia sp. RSA 1694]|nr:hypothetical protein IWW47_001380 [Coemansia sp. RSA 2052]KAJ2641465.1 hypothetical protein GGF44_002108 [Coemansia sp. RSA 1694]